MKILVLAWLALVAMVRVADAHDVKGEVVFLDVGHRGIDIEVQVPATQIALASHLSIGPDTSALYAYAARYLGATARDGRPFALAVSSVTFERPAAARGPTDRDMVVIKAHLAAPDGTDARWFTLHDDLVLHEVVTDTVYVFLRSDVQTGVLAESPTLVDQLHWQRRTVVIDRTAGSRWRGFTTVFTLGMRHIAEGYDHLLFLLVLLLPAPLLTASRRWRGRRTARESLLATAKIVTAFTLGHSLTLVIGTVHGAILPVAAVETSIAVSILVTAVHAMRPLFPGRENLIAAAFGLVHGLAFASTLAGIGVDASSLALGVFGFNLGVEAMQLCILIVAIPALLGLARVRGYQGLRVGVAAVAIVLSIVWIGERSGLLRGAQTATSPVSVASRPPASPARN